MVKKVEINKETTDAVIMPFENDGQEYFIENLGKDFLALFDSLWTIDDDERLETLVNLKQGRVKIKK